MNQKQFQYIIFNKPYGVLSQFTTNDGDRTLSEFGLPKDVYPAGRLDKDSEGLLLLTNDGPFIKKYLDRHWRTYWVCVEGNPSEEDLEKLRQGGLKIKDYMTQKAKVKYLGTRPAILNDRIPPIRYRKNIPDNWIEISLKQGKNRQVRKMTAKIGFPTLRLVRVGIGSFRLDQQFIAEGKFLKVTPEKINP
jgi:23S rRNA pseudouridine2457 synthase